MISSLRKLADRNFIVGFFLPALLGAIVFISFWGDRTTNESSIGSIFYKSTYLDLTVFVLIIWSISILLSLLNQIIYRILEGYLGPFRTERRLEIYRNLYRKEMEDLEEAFDRFENSISLDGEYDKYLERLRAKYVNFPSKDHLVLPTKFGNVIRAFETYPLEVYGVDSIATWLRLVAVIPKDYLLSIDSAKAEVDFFVNSFLAVNLCLLSVILQYVWSLYRLMPIFPWDHIPWHFLAIAVLLMVIDFLVYQGAIHQTRIWGEFVKSSFDLYLPDLAAKLGYSLPGTEKKRREFWEAVNTMFLDLNPLTPECWLARGQEDIGVFHGEGGAEGQVKTKEQKEKVGGGVDPDPDGEEEGNGDNESDQPEAAK
jgi:hypothetical protein